MVRGTNSSIIANTSTPFDISANRGARPPPMPSSIHSTSPAARDATLTFPNGPFHATHAVPLRVRHTAVSASLANSEFKGATGSAVHAPSSYVATYTASSIGAGAMYAASGRPRANSEPPRPAGSIVPPS